jgi:hypothetical protein
VEIIHWNSLVQLIYTNTKREKYFFQRKNCFDYLWSFSFHTDFITTFLFSRKGTIVVLWRLCGTNILLWIVLTSWQYWYFYTWTQDISLFFFLNFFQQYFTVLLYKYFNSFFPKNIYNTYMKNYSTSLVIGLTSPFNLKHELLLHTH